MTDHLYYTPRNQCDLQWLRNTCDKFHMYVLNLKSTEYYSYFHTHFNRHLSITLYCVF